ncbi:hypothetical protein OAE12_01245 [bacterium]|nr:hypothetical protein [bacterium]
MKKSVLIPYLLSGAAAIVAILLFFKITSLQKKAANFNKKEAKLEKTLNVYKNLWAKDSLLVSGKYNMAIIGYDNFARELGVDSMGIQARVGFAQKIIRLEKGEENSSLNLNTDSLSNLAARSPKEIALKDSLSFALEKANIQLRNLRNRLKEKSFGEYLTFESTKGNQMHYVGQVRNGMANGYGIALLDTGSRYEGQWENNQRHGEGAFYWSDGDYYVGHYENAQRNGYGTYHWHNGDKYEGYWKNDKRNGKGDFYSKEGKDVNGYWKEDKLVESTKKNEKQ